MKETIEIEITAINTNMRISIDLGHWGDNWRKMVYPYAEDMQYETTWDEITQQWLMTRKEYDECRVCRGSGTLHYDYEDEKSCWGCHGSGESPTRLDKNDVISCADFLSMQRQKERLMRRYGHERPTHIHDYWQSVSPHTAGGGEEAVDDG